MLADMHITQLTAAWCVMAKGIFNLYARRVLASAICAFAFVSGALAAPFLGEREPPPNNPCSYCADVLVTPSYNGPGWAFYIVNYVVSYPSGEKTINQLRAGSTDNYFYAGLKPSESVSLAWFSKATVKLASPSPYITFTRATSTNMYADGDPLQGVDAYYTPSLSYLFDGVSISVDTGQITTCPCGLGGGQGRGLTKIYFDVSADAPTGYADINFLAASINTTYGTTSDVATFNGRFYVSGVAPTNVPIPGTVALLGLGLVGIGAARRKQA
jgi:hypothetical protein